MVRESSYKDRWYDQFPGITEAFATFQTMKRQYRDHFAEVLTTITGKFKEMNSKKLEIKNLGPDRVTAFIKSKERKRAEDAFGNLHRALSNLDLLQDAQRNFIAKRIGISIYCMQEYQEVCARREEIEEFSEVSKLINVTMSSGLAGAKQYLLDIQVFDAQSELYFDELSQIFHEDLSGVESYSQIITELRIDSPDKLTHRNADQQLPKGNQSTKDRVRSDESGMKIQRKSID